MDILVRDVNDTILEELDKIVIKENYSSRSELIKEIITLYITTHSDFLNKSLTPTLKYLAKETYEEQADYIKKSMELVYNVNAELLKKMDKIYSLFSTFPDIEEKGP